MAFDWKATLSAVAPTIATALGGPVGGMAAKIALDAMGVKNSNGDPEAVLEQMVSTGNPDVMLKLQEADQAFKLQLKKLKIDMEKLYAEDRKDARNMGIEKGLGVQATLSGVFVVGYFIVFYILLQQFFGGLKLGEAALSTISILLGVMTGAVKDVLQFWFGSSPREQTK